MPEGEGRVALGGAVIGWADEWWKGRVIDAVDFDNRSEAMGALCPDPWAERHSPCGYPSPAQPDTYVNEEWFGILAVEQPCADGVDQLRARKAWHRLRMLWSQGGCLSHFAADGPTAVALNLSRVGGRGRASHALFLPAFGGLLASLHLQKAFWFRQCSTCLYCSAGLASWNHFD